MFPVLDIRRHGRRWRRIGQLLGLALFFFLFRHTDYSGRDELEYAVNILFRLDPFLALSASLAGGAWIGRMWPALVTLLLTFLLGRFFCGWLCPLGTLLDLVWRLLPKRRPPLPAPQLPTLRYQILLFLLLTSLAGLPLAGYFDPFSLLVRGLALAIYPGSNAATVSFFTFTYRELPSWLNAASEPVYAALRATVLPFAQKWFLLAYPALAMLLAVFLLELRARRFFCRFLCPTGAVLGLAARLGPLRGQGGAGACDDRCQLCRNICRMGAIGPERAIAMAECNFCLECLARCPSRRISFAWTRPGGGGVVLGRRELLAGLAAGLLLPLFGRARAHGQRPDPFLLRPPGALPEEEFLGRCVRCGECMQVCIGNALQPAFLEAGLEGIFTPKLLPRLGYCEYNCTLCGQVCPSGAIRRLAVAEKRQVRIGCAWFDKNRCLPYAQGIPCLVCEEHCPTPDKAIRFRQAEVVDALGNKVSVQQPYVVEERCIGCGICERKCPLAGEAAVRVTSAGETRNPRQALPRGGGYS